MIGKFIDVENGISDILKGLGIENVKMQLSHLEGVASLWDDDIGEIVKKILSSLESGFSGELNKFELELTSAIEQKEAELEKISSTSESVLYNFVRRIKEYNVNSEDYK